ncbi:MAG: DUF3775 domain-containing protein [Proteobacteria bacterium]|nr:DUF3775 domain-containing protein [Pseudomonadota bacterium]
MPNLAISSEKVAYLIIKAREFDVQDANSDPDSGSNGSDDKMIDVLEDHADNPVRQEIRAFVGGLSEDEKADLIALMQLGREDGTMEEWEAMRAQGLREHGGRVAAYLLGQPMVSDYLEDGLEQFGVSIEEFENGRL